MAVDNSTTKEAMNYQQLVNLARAGAVIGRGEIRETLRAGGVEMDQFLQDVFGRPRGDDPPELCPECVIPMTRTCCRKVATGFHKRYLECPECGFKDSVLIESSKVRRRKKRTS